MEELCQEYEQFLSADTDRLSKVRKEIRKLAFLRLLAFTGGIASLVFLPAISPTLAWGLAILLLVLFFYSVKCFVKKEKEKEFYARLIKINRDERLAMDEVYQQFDGGTEWTDADHPYSYDLDLFGSGSLFQYVNRTTTPGGKKKLAMRLTNPPDDHEDPGQRQEALLELAGDVRWRQYFSAKGPGGDPKQQLRFLDEQRTDPGEPSSLKRLFIVSPLITTSLLLLCFFSVISWGFAMLPVLGNMLILYLYRKRINACYQLFGNQTKLLESYLELFRMTEQREFKSSLLKTKQQYLLHEGKYASMVIRELKHIMSRFDYRSNIIFAMIGEFVFLWDLICVDQLNKWQKNYHQEIRRWFDAIYEFDALSSLANLNHNHPDWALPVFERNEFCFSAGNLGHPLIKRTKRVGNDFRMSGEGKIVILTGANMAGKSTFLRTIGVNMILAMNGCRVCATSLTMKPVALFTNMRVTDNLGKEESYFLAELLRLQQILTRLRAGIPLFILIDEMLKGTNSKDQLTGSKALIEELIRLQANGIVATHDLSLTDMAEGYPSNIINKCFDVRLTGQKLSFDYRLRDGVTHTMNASFLMKKMGLIR
ncbi:MAG: hypothetical protein PHI28_19880 [Mangrovibacterium sp.]|nr:hypothetical protein [Mangrovibacterium sp.]